MIQAATYTLYVRAGVADVGEAPSGPTPSSPPTLAPPTTSIGCLATFFGLALSGQASDLQLVECAWDSSSPSGALPCLERVAGDTRKLVAVRASSSRVGDAGHGAACARPRDDLEAAEGILDAIFALPAPEEHAAAGSAVDLALRSLILSNILPGVSASLWGDAACYDVLASSVYGGKLPWPLRWWLPRGLRGVSSSSSPESKPGSREVLVWRAVEALDALSASFKVDGLDEKMSARTRSLLAAVCTTIRSFPVCEAIRKASRGLDAWLDGVVRDMVVGGKPVRGMPAALADSRWSGVRVVDERLPVDGEDDCDRYGEVDGEGDGSARTDRTSTYWLVGIGALATLYGAMLLRENVQVDIE